MPNSTFAKAGYTTTAQRSRTMARIRSRDTKPELRLRQVLFHHGHRYRLHLKPLPGTPDLVFLRRKVAVFVHGCFWHGHGCHLSKAPKGNAPFWLAKVQRNQGRDRRNVDALLAQGWRVLVVWECALRTASQRADNEILAAVEGFLGSGEVVGAVVGRGIGPTAAAMG